MLAEAPSFEATEVASAAGPGEVVLHFARPLIGFEQSARYGLRSLGAQYEPYAALVSLDEPDVRFVVVPPGAVFSDYVIEIPSADRRLLGLEHADDVAVLAIVRRHGVPSPMANLMGPLVINRRTQVAAQVVLQDSDYGVMVPVDAGTARPR
ncbi:MAG: flagellar assembly protein FliW [Acidimicrobiales bacterium]